MITAKKMAQLYFTFNQLVYNDLYEIHKRSVHDQDIRKIMKKYYKPEFHIDDDFEKISRHVPCSDYDLYNYAVCLMISN